MDSTRSRRQMNFPKLVAQVATAALTAAAVMSPVAVLAADPIKVGLIVPATGPFSYMGRQINAGVSLYLAEHGDTVDGRKVQVVVKDDTGVPDTSRRLAQELVVAEKVTVLAGFG